jgi:hypothetical protein
VYIQETCDDRWPSLRLALRCLALGASLLCHSGAELVSEVGGAAEDSLPYTLRRDAVGDL